MIKKIVIYLILMFPLCYSLHAQELDARITLNTSKIQSIDGQVAQQIEEALKRIFNEQTWSQASFGINEKISCTVGITLNSMNATDGYSAEISITSRRPVYNSSYETPLLNYRDSKFDFAYTQGQSLDYNELMITNNLIGVVVFYINVMIGLDFDSFAPHGGQAYFNKAMEIANMAQSLGTKGWEPFDGKSRYDLALALTEESSKSFHSLWYNYHRMGLDEMAGNPSRGRIRILETLKDLDALYSTRPNSLLLILFLETKLEELIKVCSEATAEEKKEAKAILTKIFPGKRSLINAM